MGLIFAPSCNRPGIPRSQVGPMRTGLISERVPTSWTTSNQYDRTYLLQTSGSNLDPKHSTMIELGNSTLLHSQRKSSVVENTSSNPTRGNDAEGKAMSAQGQQAAEGSIMARQEAEAFAVRVLTKACAKHDHAAQQAEALVEGDYRGHYSHGLNRIDMYAADISSKTTDVVGDPVILKETAATALVDGKNLLGAVVGNFSMNVAIKKAKESGVGWVVAKGSNHFGIAGYYSMAAMRQGLLGMAFTNTSPIVVPTRAKKPALGTNPITLAARGKGEDTFVLDMATSTVAVGKVEIQHRLNKSMPIGWGVDKDGKDTTDPGAMLDGGGLAPLGGAEETAGYKGYGLVFMVELFCGLLAGANFGPNIRRWMTTAGEANLGQCFIAVDPEAFAPGFPERLSSLMDHLRHMESSGALPVLIPGDPEKSHANLCDKQGGILYPTKQLEHLNKVAAEWNVEPPKLLNQ